MCKACVTDKACVKDKQSDWLKKAHGCCANCNVRHYHHLEMGRFIQGTLPTQEAEDNQFQKGMNSKSGLKSTHGKIHFNAKRVPAIDSLEI